MSAGMTRFSVSVNGKYFEKRTIATVEGEQEVRIQVHVDTVKVKAPNQHIATEMADAVAKRLVEEKNKGL